MIHLTMTVSLECLAIHTYVDHVHRRWKGWGYGAAAPPDFRVLHRILIFCNINIIWPVNQPHLILSPYNINIVMSRADLYRSPPEMVLHAWQQFSALSQLDILATDGPLQPCTYTVWSPDTLCITTLQDDCVTVHITTL